MKLFSFCTPFTRSWFPFLNLRSIRMLNQATARSEEVHPWSTSVEDTYLVKLHVRALGVFYLVFSSYRSIREVYFLLFVKRKKIEWFVCALRMQRKILCFFREIFKMTRMLCRDIRSTTNIPSIAWRTLQLYSSSDFDL